MCSSDLGADDDLVPAEVLKVERGQVLRLLRLHLYAAAEHADKVGDDVGFENALVIGLQAVEDLAADGHDALKLRVARELDGAKGGIALDDIDLALRHILRAAVDELLHAVGDVKAAGQLLFDVQAGLFGRLAAPLVDEDLIGDAVSLLLVFDEVDVQIGRASCRERV